MPHRLFGCLDGSEACSAARWAKDAKREIANAHAANRLPILVGGTGLYMRTLLDGIAPIPDIDPELRARIRAMSTAQCYAELSAKDPAAAAALNPGDDSRIKRALEVIEATGKSIIDWRAAKTGGIGQDIMLRPLLLLPPRDWLHARCDQRFEAMLATGASDEVRTLLEKNLPHDAPVMRAIGVPEISAMLSGEIDATTALSLGQAATRQYAKRQYTWFKNQSPAHWPRWSEELNNMNIKNIEILLLF